VVEACYDIHVSFVIYIVFGFIQADREILPAYIHILKSVDSATFVDSKATCRTSTGMSLKTTNKHKFVVRDVDALEVPWDFNLSQIIFIDEIDWAKLTEMFLEAKGL
jgi:hypothetical protein